MSKEKQSVVVIDKQEWDFDFRLLSEIMTDRIDEFAIPYNDKLDLYGIWETAYECITKESRTKGNNLYIDSHSFSTYIKLLNTIYKKAWKKADYKEVICTNWLSKRLPELKDCASINVFETIWSIINKYRGYAKDVKQINKV